MICMFACGRKKDSPSLLNIEHSHDFHVIDIDNIKKEDRINCSNYFRDVETIILETNETSLISSIDGIQVLDNNIYVLDKDLSNIYVFDKQGKFLNKIGTKGIGPNEYLSIADFTIDSKNKLIYILDNALNKVFVYDLITNNYSHSINLDSDNTESYNIQIIDNALYTDAVPLSNTKNSFLLQKINMESGRHESTCLNAEKYNKGWNEPLTKSESLFYSKNHTCPKYIQMFMDTVIAICGNKAIPFLVVKTHDWVNTTDIKNLQQYKKENHGSYNLNIINEKKRIFNISQFMEVKDLIYFNYEQQMERHHVLYNISTRNTFISRLFADDLVYSDIGQQINSIFCCSDENGLYAYIHPAAMPYFVNYAINGVLKNDLDKKDKLINLPEDSNPVLFYYKYRY